ncbi:alanyl-tRNA editing protein AlaX [Candidatus Woesearchaeota archaeon]|nr:alanyl-tRNA editing protein AlaX [Candidatus Woesearchaeota archaeon]
MTKLLYLEDSYTKEFAATVIEVIDGTGIVLDQTYFYPRGGGQLDDRGVLVDTVTDESFVVCEVFKKEGKAIHKVERSGLKPGSVVRGVLEWSRRYRMMRMHTASHVVTGIIAAKLGALITGHQLGLEKSRTDFNLEEFDKQKIQECFDLANKYIEEDIPVTTYMLPREEALNNPKLVKLANVLPPSVKDLRIVKIGDVDEQADGGTHVKSLKECGALVFLKGENKGKNNRRVYFGLEE